VVDRVGGISRCYGERASGQVEDDLNLYAYPHDDPLDKADPTGTDGGCALAGGDCESAFSSSSPGGAIAAGLDFLDANVFTPLGPALGGLEHLAAVPLVAGLRALAGDTKVAEGVESGARSASAIPDSHAVVRGGADITPESIAAGTSDTPVGSGFSANSAPTVEGAATDIRNNQVGVTTAGDVRAAGGDVHDTSHARNPTHVTVTGLTPAKASKLLSPSVKNPVPKCDRRCLNNGG
jgi:hypothetical protein